MTMKSLCLKSFHNIVEMGMPKTEEQMGKFDPKCQYKTTILEKWLFEILNETCFKHPHVMPPTLDVNPT